MNDYEKLKKILSETDKLIGANITNSDPAFEAWEMRVKRFITSMFGEKSIEMKRFNETTFWSINYTEQDNDIFNITTCRNGLITTKAILETYLEEFDDIENNSTGTDVSEKRLDYSKIFIVHGHDGELKESVARIIEKQGIHAIILSEQSNQGRTIIEKFEQNSDVGCAICLFTGDDYGRAKAQKDDKLRARQNVVFEAGYFIGKLGRNHIVILSDSGIEIPSDLAGVVYTNTDNWKVDLLKDLKALGYNVDFNKLF